MFTQERKRDRESIANRYLVTQPVTATQAAKVLCSSRTLPGLFTSTSAEETPAFCQLGYKHGSGYVLAIQSRSRAWFWMEHGSGYNTADGKALGHSPGSQKGLRVGDNIAAAGLGTRQEPTRLRYELGLPQLTCRNPSTSGQSQGLPEILEVLQNRPKTVRFPPLGRQHCRCGSQVFERRPNVSKTCYGAMFAVRNQAGTYETTVRARLPSAYVAKSQHINPGGSLSKTVRLPPLGRQHCRCG
ncbi:hypothetical protein Bbelb_224050 [Branchiostoma belcheri]|nr:hypothetical protein Bbelb_224050 [Branchiostoma belcheri]